MNIDQLAKIAGVLGFLISVSTFILTRWERRAILTFSLDSGSSLDFAEQDEEGPETINLTITNMGARALLVDLGTLKIECNGNVLDAWIEDHWGVAQREILFKTTDHQMLGIPLETFTAKLKIETPKKYDDNSFHFMYPLKISVKTIDGKEFSSKNLKYWEATGEFHRA